MLGKLIKYEMKALMRYLIPFCVVMVALFGAMVIGFASKFETVIDMSVGLIFMVSIMWMLIGGFIVVFVRFNQGMFSDESYLIHTTPVSANKILLSKLISHTLLIVAYVVVILVIGFGILFVTAAKTSSIEWYSAWNRIIETIGPREIMVGLLLVIAGLVSTAEGILFSYATVSVANLQMFKSHKKLAGAIFFIGVSEIVTYIEDAIGVYGGGNGLLEGIFGSNATHNGYFYSVTTQGGTIGAFQSILLITIVVGLVKGIIWYLGSYYVVSNKLNLD